MWQMWLGGLSRGTVLNGVDDGARREPVPLPCLPFKNVQVSRDRFYLSAKKPSFS